MPSNPSRSVQAPTVGQDDAGALAVAHRVKKGPVGRLKTPAVPAEETCSPELT
jgi:hypothetical protein